MKGLISQEGKTPQGKKHRKAKAAGNPFFHRLRPPDEHHRKRTLKSEVTKPDRTIKIPDVSPRRLPRALSCSCLSVTGVIPLLWPRFSHSTPDTQFRVGSSLQAGLYARPPRSVRLLRLIR